MLQTIATLLVVWFSMNGRKPNSRKLVLSRINQLLKDMNDKIKEDAKAAYDTYKKTVVDATTQLGDDVENAAERQLRGLLERLAS